VSESTSRVVRARVVRRILVSTVGVEAVLVGGGGIVAAVDALRRNVSTAGSGVALAAFAVVIAVGLVLVARATLRGSRGARAPIIVWQILQAAAAKVALDAGSGPGVWIGVGLLVLAVVGLVGALWPGVLED
jgi:hypothetical protein